jgi:C4-dicarboxylate-binding protein DctP
LLLQGANAGAQPTKLRVTLQLPVTGHLGQNLVLFKEQVERRSEGAVSVEIFDNSRLYRDDQVVEAVSSGAIEMGSTTYQQFTGKVPALGIFEQPFLFNIDGLARAAVHPDSELRQLLDDAVLKATGTRVLWWQAYGSSVLFAKGLDARLPVGIAGRKVRVFGENMGDFTRYCGGTPMLISASKQFKAMQDGTVDYIMSGITTVETRELWKVTDTITRTEHAALEFLVVINENVWQALGAKVQAIVLEVARKVEQDLRNQTAEIDAKAYALARAKGMTVHEVTPDELVEWRACSAPLLEDYMKDTGDLGSKLLVAYAKLRLQPCCSAGPPGGFTKR